MTDAALRCLILPADLPPRRSSIKRQLLFFDSVTIVHPEDRALLNDYEVRERYADGTEIQWTSRAPFPRSQGYEDTLHQILEDTKGLQMQGKIDVLTRAAALSKIDGGTHWAAYSAAVSDATLVRAAIPDFHNDAPAIQLPSGVYVGLGVHLSGRASRYEVETKPPAKLPGVDDAWNSLAWIRTGRHLKYARLAAALGSVPLSLDEPNRQLSLALAQGGTPSLQALADHAIAVDSVDPIELDRALQSISWKETLSWRKQILPHIGRLRAEVIQKARHAQLAASKDPAAMAKALATLKTDYQKLKEEVDRKWSELGVATVTKAMGVVGASQAGLSLFPTLPISDVAIRVVAGGLAATAALSAELKALIPALTKRRAHPLAFFDCLPSEIAGRGE
jgi:hypothetical protein